MKPIEHKFKRSMEDLKSRLAASLTAEQKRLILSLALEQDVAVDGEEFVFEGSKRFSIAKVDEGFSKYLDKALPPQGLQMLSVWIEEKLEARSDDSDNSKGSTGEGQE